MSSDKFDSNGKRKVIVLGSTGSIGTQTIDVAKKNPNKIEIVALACGTNTSKLLEQAKDLGVHKLVVGGESASNLDALSEYAHQDKDGFFGQGTDALLDLIRNTDADLVVNALVGSYGLQASYETLKSGKELALANKESLVVGGDLIMPLARKMSQSDTHWQNPSGAILPIDSEHGAIFQCLIGENMDDVSRLWITASGGPFRGKARDQLVGVKASDALAHPTWSMGPKITIDSSTLMNKGLEVIEAHHLFGMPYDQIDVVVHPQSVIHSMVEFSDASVKAHLGTTDMRIPIQFALSYPDRFPSPVKPLDFRELSALEFSSPDMETFKCLKLAYEAGNAGGTLPCAMNAANEVAVALFLDGKIDYLDIADCVEYVMDNHVNESVSSIENLLNVDASTREEAKRYLANK